jgi:hypothetical protein
MTPKLQNAIAAVQSLSTQEQLQILQIISEILQQSHTLENQNQLFWQGESIENLLNTQQPPIVKDIKTLAGEYWGEDSIEDFLSFLNEQRQLENVTVE